jgi:hypothetical protein
VNAARVTLAVENDDRGVGDIPRRRRPHTTEHGPKSDQEAADPVFVTVAEHPDEEHGTMIACPLGTAVDAPDGLLADARGVAGFCDCCVVRTGPRELTMVTIYDSQAASDRASEQSRPILGTSVGPDVARPPERAAGEIVAGRGPGVRLRGDGRPGCRVSLRATSARGRGRSVRGLDLQLPCLPASDRNAFGIQAGFKADQVQVSGRFSDYARVSDEADRKEHVFHFCPDCGSQVFYTEPKEPDLVVVSVGSFADPSFPPPTESRYDSWRHPWVGLPDSIQRPGPRRLGLRATSLRRREVRRSGGQGP